METERHRPAFAKAIECVSLAKETARLIDGCGSWAQASEVIDSYGRAGAAFKELIALLPKEEAEQWRHVLSELTRWYISWMFASTAKMDFEPLGEDENAE